MGKKLNEKDYALGETLPAHLSPFIIERRVGDYMPPEEQAFKKAEEQGEDQEQEEEEEDDDDEDESEEEEEEEQPEVKEGKREVVNKEEALKEKENEEFRLRELMIPRKHRGLYKSMMK